MLSQPASGNRVLFGLSPLQPDGQILRWRTNLLHPRVDHFLLPNQVLGVRFLPKFDGRFDQSVLLFPGQTIGSLQLVYRIPHAGQVGQFLHRLHSTLRSAIANTFLKAYVFHRPQSPGYCVSNSWRADRMRMDSSPMVSCVLGRYLDGLKATVCCSVRPTPGRRWSQSRPSAPSQRL